MVRINPENPYNRGMADSKASAPVKPLPGRRTTIGLLSTGTWHSLFVELWCGVLSAAQSKGVGLVFYSGDEIHAHHEAYTDMPNVLYDLVDPDLVDGLIVWTSAIGSLLSDEELRVFCGRFKPLPILCVGRKVEGLPFVGMDTLGGVRQVLEHLIRDHGFGRIAFIRGPEDNIDAEQRYATHLDVLAKNNLAVDPILITPPAPWRTANENILVLVRDRQLRPGADFQAVMGVGDVIAARVVRTLQECGFGVPQDVAVVGYDGEEAAKEASPLQIPPLP
jgi:DNA-binding LacI/PurR family transcriptional regulator